MNDIDTYCRLFKIERQIQKEIGKNISKYCDRCFKETVRMNQLSCNI